MAQTMMGRFGNIAGMVMAALMLSVLGVIVVTGRWPIDAPRTHVEAGGILPVPPERVSRVTVVAGAQRSVFGRGGPGGWLVEQAETTPVVASHIETGVRLLTITAPRRTLSADEYSRDQLGVYGLDPPHLVLEISESGGETLRVAFGEATPAGNAQYVSIAGRPELYLVPRDVGEEWQLARDMAGHGADQVLPVSISRVWAVEIVSGGVLYRFERDPAGLWFHHVGQHVHAPGGFVHQADPKLAPLIEAELSALDGMRFTRVVSRHPDAAMLDERGVEHAATILLLYSRDTAGPVARVALGNAVGDGSGRYARVTQNDALVVVPPEAEQHLAALVRLGGSGP
ncbi:MAG TPA: DUF4340 domain-containing protein [Rhodopila sp.]|nr:DUF4340 domain-containing protein [Rhodopila sp.]